MIRAKAVNPRWTAANDLRIPVVHTSLAVLVYFPRALYPGAFFLRCWVFFGSPSLTLMAWFSSLHSMLDYPNKSFWRCLRYCYSAFLSRQTAWDLDIFKLSDYRVSKPLFALQVLVPTEGWNRKLWYNIVNAAQNLVMLSYSCEISHNRHEKEKMRLWKFFAILQLQCVGSLALPRILFSWCGIER